jgi:isocitrate dehydrogenase kinase/phosphatase
MPMFPQRLDSPLAYDIADAMLDGFNRHYRLFRQESARAKHRFETADWHAQQRAQRERITFYDQRVREAVQRLEKEFKAGEQPMDVWQQVKLHYIGLLVDHHQPELAETFFNSVTTKILHRTHFHNDFIFVRPAVALTTPRATRCTTPSCASSTTSSCSIRSRTCSGMRGSCWKRSVPGCRR